MTAPTPESLARDIIAAADRAEARARRANTQRIIACPNQSEGPEALAKWRSEHPYVDENEARVKAVADFLRGHLLVVGEDGVKRA